MSAARRHTDLRYVESGKRPSWDAIRAYILRKHPVCQLCGDPSAEVDHRWPRHYGGDDQEANLQGLCSACNRSKGNTVLLSLADDVELVAALSAISERIASELEDFARFAEMLEHRAMSDDEAGLSARRGAYLVLAHLGAICATADYERSYLRQALKTSGQPLDAV